MEQRECFFDEEELNLYMDGEVSEVRKQYLKSHLLSCEKCASQFDIANNLKHAVKNACDDTMAPPWIREKILIGITTEEPKQEALFWGALKNFFKARPMAPVGMVAMLIIVLVTALFYGGQKQHNMPFIHNLVLEHKEYLEEAIDLGIRTSDPNEISGWVNANTGMNFHFPTGEKAPVPGGACKLQLEGQTIGYVYFENDGSKVSLFMLDNKFENLFGQKTMKYEDISMYCGNCTEMNYVLWKADDLICVLVGDLSESSLFELAKRFI